MDDHSPPIVLSAPACVHPDARGVEVVERKGRGHPDSICDALAEAFSIGLTRAYHERCGAVLHHNVDKVLLVGGSSTPRFGGGRVTTPIEVYLAGRATHAIDAAVIPVADIGEQSALAWLRANLHALDPARDVRIHTLVRPGSSALSALVAREPGRRGANDTSIAVGYAPASRLERVVLAVEQALAAPATIAAHPMLGEDVKVLGVRRGRAIDLTIACAIVDRHVRTLADYLDARESVARLAEQAARTVYDHPVRVAVNTADDIAAERIYLTVTGTSAEAGDDGEVGRGNRIGGLITPYRPMTIEAAAGKNVVSHVGKSYGIVAHQIARQLVGECPGIAAATCVLVSRIGSPVDAPQVVELQIQMRDGAALETVREPAEAIARNGLLNLVTLPELLLGRGSTEAPAAWPGFLLF